MRSPECSPMRTIVSLPFRENSVCMARAASQARSACPSCARGAPKSAMIPSPIARATVPSKRITVEHIVAKAGFRSANDCSGSSPLMISVEPTMSANITVACFRSAFVPTSGEPQKLQKRAVGESLWPQCRHVTRRLVPQLVQKLLPGMFSVWHAWHSIDRLSHDDLP